MLTITNYELCELCRAEQWFTCGSIRAYNRMFEMNKMQMLSIHELALIIYFNSDIEDVRKSLDTIEHTLLNLATPK